MYCDLNIPCRTNPDRISIDKLKLILSRLSQFQECTVALNFTMEGKKLPTVSEKYDIDKDLLNCQFPLTILTRVTMNTNEPLEQNTIQELRKEFDLIAIRTNSLNTFKEACTNYDIDMISLPCTERLSFELNSIDVNKALERGVYFELCYANAIRDVQARTYTMQVAKQLFEYTHGNKLIVSSEAEIVSEIRNPADIFYFAKSIGLPNDKAKFTVEKNCEQLLNIARNK
ncbi:RNase P subunit p30-domain-containing protein [Pilaira anomala]|nr:RNase P subunit p30-domain-containing protein [Pilaira anomala]